MTESSEGTRKVNFTDRFLKSLKPKPERYEIRDGGQPGLSVRVTPNGAMTFALRARFPGSPHFTRKALGTYPTLKLAEARGRAQKWIRLIADGKDPKAEAAAEAERARAEAERVRQDKLKKQKHTFAHVAERYIEEVTPLQRQRKDIARNIRNVLIPRWGQKPIAEIDREDVATLLTQRRKTPAMAHNLFVYTKCIFGWAIETQEFGLQNAPTDHIKPAKLIGERKERDHTLNDAELAAFWSATGRLEYPERDAYQLLALTGLRLNEVVRAGWQEFNLEKHTWLIPASRMKGRSSGKRGAREHLVPLTDRMVEILERLPRFEGGDFLFTTTNGRKPFALGGRAKREIDRLMLAELRIKNPKAKLVPWVNHDIRRSCSTNLSALKVPKVVAELVLAHKQGGVAAIYDRHEYIDEKREALQKWGDYLLGLAGPQPEPVPSNVVKIRRRA